MFYAFSIRYFSSKPVKSQTSLYVIGGTNFSKLNITKESNGHLERSFKPGFQIGIITNFPIANNLSLSPSIQLANKRETTSQTLYIPGSNNTPNILEIQNKTSQYHIDLPVSLKYQIPLGKLKTFIIGGPFLNTRVSSSGETKAYENGVQTNLDNEGTMEEKNLFNRMDFGVNIGLGIEKENFLVQATYDYGIFRAKRYIWHNMGVETELEQTTRSSILKLTFGYKL